MMEMGDRRRMVQHRFLRMWSPLALACFIAACSQSSFDQPLSSFGIRDALVDHVVVVSENGENIRYLHLGHDSVATVNGPSAEFGTWRINDADELCLLWHDQPERCASVYATGGSHYRLGDTELSVLGP